MTDETEQQESNNVPEPTPQIVLTNNLFGRFKDYLLPTLVVLGSGLFGYIAYKVILTTSESVVVEKPISSRTLEEQTYVTINDVHFMVDERVGKNLSDLERELEEKLGKAYDVKESEVDTKYNGMTGKVADEAKKAWGLEVKEPIKETKKTEETNYHENIKKLNSMYDVIINLGKNKK